MAKLPPAVREAYEREIQRLQELLRQETEPAARQAIEDSISDLESEMLFDDIFDSKS